MLLRSSPYSHAPLLTRLQVYQHVPKPIIDYNDDGTPDDEQGQERLLQELHKELKGDLKSEVGRFGVFSVQGVWSWACVWRHSNAEEGLQDSLAGGCHEVGSLHHLRGDVCPVG
jgi:hypothetical protein